MEIGSAAWTMATMSGMISDRPATKLRRVAGRSIRSSKGEPSRLRTVMPASCAIRLPAGRSTISGR